MDVRLYMEKINEYIFLSVMVTAYFYFLVAQGIPQPAAVRLILHSSVSAFCGSELATEFAPFTRGRDLTPDLLLKGNWCFHLEMRERQRRRTEEYALLRAYVRQLLYEEKRATLDSIEAEYKEQLAGLRRDAEAEEQKLAEQWAYKHLCLAKFLEQMGCQ
ncbi:hypothetical protein FXO37_29885 [Capsicum annuum]|nr:hypothetical protein FXO37_29885 [Capsicum annuum]